MLWANKTLAWICGVGVCAFVSSLVVIGYVLLPKLHFAVCFPTGHAVLLLGEGGDRVSAVAAYYLSSSVFSLISCIQIGKFTCMEIPRVQSASNTSEIVSKLV